MATPSLAASHQSQALWDKPGIKKMFSGSLGNPFPDAKYTATSQYGMAGDIGNWVNDKMHGGPQTQVERSRAMNTLVTGKPTVTGLADRGVVPLNTQVVTPVTKPIVQGKPVVADTVRTAPRVSTKPSTAKVTTASMKAPPALVAPTSVEVPEVSGIGNVNLSGLAENGAQLYSSGYSGASDPMNAFKDYGFEPTSASTMGGTGSASYTPGMYTSGATDTRPEFFKANPEGQYTNLAGEGTVSLATPQNGGMNWDMGDIAKGVEAASGLANAYLGYKNYGLAKDQFGFTKAMANRNIANQASEYNTGLQNAGEVGMSLAGNTMDPNARAARQAQLDAQKISGAPIG